MLKLLNVDRLYDTPRGSGGDVPHVVVRADERFVAQSSRTMVRRNHPQNASDTERSVRSTNWKRPFAHTSAITLGLPQPFHLVAPAKKIINTMRKYGRTSETGH